MSELWALAAVYAGEYGNKPEVISVGTRKQVDADIDSHANELDAATDWGVVRVGTVHGNPTCRDEFRGGTLFKCSECGHVSMNYTDGPGGSRVAARYCPNCGARRESQ